MVDLNRDGGMMSEPSKHHEAFLLLAKRVGSIDIVPREEPSVKKSLTPCVTLDGIHETRGHFTEGFFVMATKWLEGEFPHPSFQSKRQRDEFLRCNASYSFIADLSVTFQGDIFELIVFLEGDTAYIPHRCDLFEAAGPLSLEYMQDCVVELARNQQATRVLNELQRNKPTELKTTRKPKVGFVYIIKSEDDRYKIGQTNNLASRFKSLKTASPFNIEMIHHFATCDSVGLEAALQARFHAQRIRGEWFELSTSDVEWLRNLDAEEFLSR